MRSNKLYSFVLCFVVLIFVGCQQPDSKGNPLLNPSTASSTSSSNTNSSTSSSINAIQVIMKADTTGSFDAVSVPAANGTTVKASRIFALDGSLISTGQVPTWYVESRVFLTSTRTSAGTPAYTTSDTPCAYFDSYNADNNKDTSGFYTIDGYNVESLATGSTDIDQCAGTAASELNQLGAYIRVDRRFMNSTDKFQLIVKAKAIDAPNTAPTTSSCVVGGYFDASNCSNQVFTVSMRTAPGAASKPFYNLFPSAKALDLLSESILLPVHMDQSITTISIDRVKGGAIFYGITLIRLQ